MSKYVAEAFVPTPDAERLVQKVCDRSREYCTYIGVVGTDTLLDFTGGGAILRPTDEGLQFRVEAKNVVTFYAIRTLLQGSLSATAVAFRESVEWRPIEEGSEKDPTWLSVGRIKPEGATGVARRRLG